MSAEDEIEFLSQQINIGNRKALEKLKQLADAPNEAQSKAAFRLGLMHDGTGPMGILNDFNEAQRYYRLAAELGHPKAQFFLGNMFEFGEGVPQDWEIARGWYERAAKSGELNAQMNLARILETGRGGVKDVEQAATWYLEAAKRGDAQAATNLAFMHLRNDLCSSDLNLAIQLFEFSATKLDGVACLQLGRMYLEGVAIERSYENAIMHLCLAKRLLPAGDNLDAAQEYLGMLMEGLDPSVMEHFVGKANDYIDYCRGLSH